MPIRSHLRLAALAGIAAALGGCAGAHTKNASFGVVPETSTRPSTPDASLAALKAGNARFVSGEVVANHGQIDREAQAASQAPWAAVLRCADSRVAPEIIFDAEKGDLFVPAVAGNFPTTELIASMEFAVLNLQTNLIVVCGHSACGAIDAAIRFGADPSGLPGSLPALVEALQSPCVQGVAIDEDGALDGAVRCAARHSTRQVVGMSKVLRDKIAAGELKVVGAYFDIGTGKVEWLEAG